MSHSDLPSLGPTLTLARDAVGAVGIPRSKIDGFERAVERLARAGLPRLAEGRKGDAYAFAAVLPRIVGSRRDGAYEGNLRGFMRYASGRRGGDIGRFSIGPVAFGDGASVTLGEALQRVGLDAREADRRGGAGVEAGFPASVLAGPTANLYGLREADAIMAAVRPMIESYAPARDGDVLRMPWDGTVAFVAGAQPHLALRIGDHVHRVAQLKAGVEAREIAVRAGEAIALPPGSLPLSRGIDEALFMPIAQALCEAYAAEAAAVLAAFADRLDRRLVAPLRPLGLPVAGYNWLRAAGGGQAFGDRCQALEAFPVLASVDPGPAVDAAVDGRRPLIPALAERFGGGPACVRALRGLSLPEIGGPDTLAILPALAGIEPRHLPGPGGARPRGEQWKALAGTVLAWRRVLGGRGGVADDPASLRGVMASEPPHWQRRVRGADREDPVSQVDDYLDAITRHLVLPVALDLAQPPTPGLERAIASALDRHLPHPPMAPVRPFLDGRHLAEVRAAAKAWHGRVDEIEAELRLGPGPRGHLSWAPLSEAYAIPGTDLEVVPLSTAEDLATEGRTMRHCVASYVTRCMYRGSHVLSVRRAGVRISTVHLDLSGPASAPYYVREHKAARNAPAPEEARAALRAYLDALLAGRLERNPDASRPPVGEVPVPGLMAVGYDPAIPGARDLALRLYGFALPPEERGLAHAAWAGRHGLAEALLPVVRAAVAAAFDDRQKRAALFQEMRAVGPGALEEFRERIGMPDLGKPAPERKQRPLPGW